MEINNLPQTNEIFIKNQFSSENLRKLPAFADYFVSPTQLLNQANNFVLILSIEGKVKSVSSSFIDFTGYSEHELIALKFDKLFLEGEFSIHALPRQYYFKSLVVTKQDQPLKIIWRLLPDVLINSIVYVGYLE